jgi:uncharacterized protein (DUF342 family)
MRWHRRDSEIWLEVGEDEQLVVDDVVRAADESGYLDLDFAAVEQVLADRESRAVARVDATLHPGSVEVVVAADGMTATVQVDPPGSGRPGFGASDVIAALNAAGVRLGIDIDLLATLPLDVPGSHEVASGWPAEPGRDGWIEYDVAFDHEFKPQVRDDGSVDFHSVATIPDVAAGQLLAVLMPPLPGTPGRTVTGEVVEGPPGEPAELPVGDNVTASEDGQKLYAAIDGLLQIEAGHVSVRPDLVIPGDVDHTSGSIDFRGDVVIRGSVRPGFLVRAGGKVVVMGDVDQAEVEAKNLVWVRGGVIGERSWVRSGRDVKVGTVREGRVEARGTVFVVRELQDASVLAAEKVVLEAPRNRIAGGTIRAGNEVSAGEIGSVAGIPTEVAVGLDPFNAEAVAALRTEREQRLKALDRVLTTVAPFSGRQDLVDTLAPRPRAALVKLMAVEAALRARLEEIDVRLADLTPAEPDARPRIAARLAFRPGVALQVKHSLLQVTTAAMRSMAVEAGERVLLTPLGAAPATTGAAARVTAGV